MLSLLLASALSIAQAQERDFVEAGTAEAPVPEVPAPEPVIAPADPVPANPTVETALILAADLRADGDHDAARDVLHWVLDQQLTADVRTAAALQLARLPAPEDSGHDVGPTVRLVAWQAAMGAYLLGPNLLINEPLGYAGDPYVALSMIGGGLGAGSALLLAKHHGVDSAAASTIIGVEQLGLLNGAVLGYALTGDSSLSRIPGGMMFGAGVGAGVGALWTLQDPDPAASLGMQWGAYWGTGLGFAVMAYTYAFDELHEDSIYPMALAANLGALGGWTLTRGLGLSRHDVRMFNAGALVGGLGAFGFAWITSNIVWYTEHGVAAFVTGATVAGGLTGVALNRWLITPPAERLFGRRLASFSLPTPTLVPYDGRAIPGVLLTEVQF